MKIKPRTFHAFAAAFPKPDPHIGFIGAFIFTEADIAVNLEKALHDRPPTLFETIIISVYKRPVL
jgi:hypothetical protein